MPTYVLLSKLSPGNFSDSETRRTIGRDWLSTLKEKCPEVHWKEHYALLGEYDFMDIYEAPDEKAAAKVAMITMSKGAMNAVNLTAIPYKEYLEVIKDI